MRTDGTCPSCGRLVEVPEVQPSKVPPSVLEGKSLDGKALRELAGKDARAPWHFKLLVVALIVYLGWRLVDLVGIV